MSDTPLDVSLDNKRSMRFPPWLVRRVKRFRQEYNETLDKEYDVDNVGKFRLENDSEAMRRLLDIGLSNWFAGSEPMGFGFDPGEDLHCPECYADDPAKFRAGVEVSSDDPEDYTLVVCLGCGAQEPYEAFVVDEAGPFDGITASE